MVDLASFLSRFSGPVMTRRAVLKGAATTAALWPLAALAQGGGQAAEIETHGLSSFGELLYPPDFRYFAYVNPDAPKGGRLTMQIRSLTGNQNFDTFNTLNIFVLQGDGAAGMDMTFDSLMASSADEPSSMYGLLARAVRISADKLTYRFLLRPEARFHDGTPVTAADVAFSFNVLKERGHPIYQALLDKLVAAETEGEGTFVARFAPDRTRDLHLVVASMPIFSKAYWERENAEKIRTDAVQGLSEANKGETAFEVVTLKPPLGSGAYKVGKFEPGRFIEFERVPDYWGNKLPVNVGTSNFDNIRYVYYRERPIAFEAFKNGTVSFHQEFTSRNWALGYDFPAIRDGRIKKENIPNNAPTSTQGWLFNLRREQFKDPRVRQAIGLAFDFEWVNKNIMFSSYERLNSYFQNTDMEAKGLPSPEELALLEPFRASLPEAVFGEPVMAPVSDGSGSDRNLLRKAFELLKAAGCELKGATLHLPNGRPFEIEFLAFDPSMQPHTLPFHRNLELLGIKPRSRIVDASQYQARMNEFDFDIVSRAIGGSTTPGEGMDDLYGSRGAVRKGSYNISGIAHPAIDALIDKVAKAHSREELNISCRALDRVLRAGYYWVPMWYKAVDWYAYWDEYSRPEMLPRYGTGAPGTWWYDIEKAKRIGRAS